MACWKIHYFYRWLSYWNPISSGFPIATFHYRRSGGYVSSNIIFEQPPISAPDSPGFAARPPDASARTLGSARWLSTHAGRRPWRGDGRGQRQSGWGKTSANQGDRIDEWWLNDGWMMVEWWLNDGWMMVEWWLNDGWMMVEWWLNGWWLGLYHPLSWDYHWIIDEWRLYSYTPTTEWFWYTIKGSE